MLSAIFSFITGIASIYFFYQNSFFVGIVLLVFTVIRFPLHGTHLQGMAKEFLGITQQFKLERRSNVVIELRINIENVLKHASVQRLFCLLQEDDGPTKPDEWNYKALCGEPCKQKIISETNFDAWVAQLINNFKNKYQSPNGYEPVRFHIKGNALYKQVRDGHCWSSMAIDFDDRIFHKIFIPYQYSSGNEEPDAPPQESTEHGITIRIVIVNGHIRLQVGKYPPAYSPILNNDQLSTTYLTYDTVATFPLLYYCYNIPEDYLCFAPEHTESWKVAHRYNEKIDDKAQKALVKKWVAEWKGLLKELKDYYYICNHEFGMSIHRFLKIREAFWKKAKATLADERFIDDCGVYSNSFLMISFHDYSRGDSQKYEPGDSIDYQTQNNY
ncbi:MAG: hypothetical protein ACD_62C00164G0011 [uncultured bacterium]|nr:MAG: hypothetical protein ACD_62C00164G0011 [uncultured bacterium]